MRTLAVTAEAGELAAANAKIDCNEMRYPAGQVRGQSKEYDQY
jgi:hypothetical protein